MRVLDKYSHRLSAAVTVCFTPTLTGVTAKGDASGNTMLGIPLMVGAIILLEAIATGVWIVWRRA